MATRSPSYDIPPEGLQELADLTDVSNQLKRIQDTVLSQDHGSPIATDADALALGLDRAKLNRSIRGLIYLTCLVRATELKPEQFFDALTESLTSSAPPEWKAAYLDRWTGAKNSIIAAVSSNSTSEYPNIPAKTRDVGFPARQDIAERITFAVSLLESLIAVDPNTRGGTPTIVGTRFPVSRIFSEVANGRSIDEIADDKDLDIEVVRQLFIGFAAYLGRPFLR